MYTFEATPDAVRDAKTKVRLLAEVWQYSGMDWSKARLTLANGAARPARTRAPCRAG